MFESRKWIKLFYLAMCLLVFVIGCSSGETTNLTQDGETSLRVEQAASNQQAGDAPAINNAETAEVLDEGAQETRPGDADVEEAKLVAEESKAGNEAESTNETEEVKEEKRANSATEAKPTAEDKLAATPSAETKITPSNNGENKAEPVSSSTPTVTLAIIGPQGEDYIILEETEVEWQEGDTVLDVLKRVTRDNKIHMEFRGRNATAYVEGIDNLYEFDRGSLSGWLYRVNGDFPNRSAGIWSVSAGDKIEWLYTIDLGKDVGGYMQGIEG